MIKQIILKNKELEELVSGEELSFPKYTTQILNLANQNAQGTRPSVVGQMSELIQEFPGKSVAEWDAWYRARHPEAIKEASKKIYTMVAALKEAMGKIDEKLTEEWVTNLVILKTFIGLKFQETILKKISELVNKPYKLSEAAEEAQGIDGYIGDTPISIKPISYKTEMALPETINCQIVYYEKKKDGIAIEFDL